MLCTITPPPRLQPRGGRPVQVGKLAAEVLLSAGRGERVTATPERLEGISLTV